MSSDERPSVSPPTLGERLADAAADLADRHRVDRPWTNALAPVLRRSTALPRPDDPRWRRAAPPVPPPASEPPLRDVLDLPDDVPPPDVDPPGATGASPGAGRTTASAYHVVEPLPSDVADRLGRVLGADLTAVRVRTDAVADALAHEHRADAVMVSEEISFRTGRFRPREAAGFALLAHEATHVLHGRNPTAAAARAHPSGLRAEESRARAVEHAVARPGPAGTQATPGTAAGPPARRRRTGRTTEAETAAADIAVASGAPVMAAAQDRPPPGNSASHKAPAAPTAVDRYAAQRDLVHALRIDAERGG